MFPEFLSLGLHTCLHCGSFSVWESLLCFSCERKLFAVAMNQIEFCRDVKNIPCLSLFRWQKDRNRILNRLSVALKGQAQALAWNYYAECFLAQWVKHETPAISAVFVPCPSVNDAKDHAFLFAHALSKLTKIPLLNALKRVDVKEQKRMSRLERQRFIETKFGLRSEVNEKFSHVYFVDDIITTGTTIQAAKNHLNKLGHVKALSLIIRE
jgi:predicted amidophosphoribosyltransferase